MAAYAFQSPNDAQPLRLPEQHGIRPTLPSLHGPPVCAAEVTPSIHSLLWPVSFVAVNCLSIFRSALLPTIYIQSRQERSHCKRRSFNATLRRCGLRGRGLCRYRPGSIYHASAYDVCSSLSCDDIHPDQCLGTQSHVFLWQQCGRAEWRVRRRCIP